MAKEPEKITELDERKVKILVAVIRNYLETGEPVGSRTISKYTDLKLSSATIRNEMADLEEMGYIFQPHTSSGRIPTDKGYRFAFHSPTNQIFISLSKEEAAALSEKVEMAFWENTEDSRVVMRIATSWTTTEEDTGKLIECL